MLQLSGLDTAFLNMETNATFGHVSQLILLKAGKLAPGAAHAALRDHFAARAELLAPFYRRLVPVPMGLDRPYWIDGGEVDIDFHVRHIGLPPPGTQAQLAELVARTIERPLDRRYPLWELYVIEGLASGEVALLLKLHHAAIDGQSSMEMYKVLFDGEAQPAAAPPPPERATEAEPEPWELLTRSYISMLRNPRRVFDLQVDAVKTFTRFVAGGARSPFLPGLENFGLGWLGGDPGTALLPNLQAPRTPFNGSISGYRSVAFAEFPLDQLKAIKTAAGTTLNDVVMAICSGALRRYLMRKGVLPAEPLIAMVPVSVRTGEETETYSNQVSAMLGELATDEADPRARLARISAAMTSAKELHNAIPASLLQDFSKFASPAVAAQAARTVASLRLADRVGPLCNVVISNVPGPRETLYIAGCEVAALIPVSTVGDGMGLNMTVVSYRDRLDFGYVACRERVPDLQALIDDTRDAIAELSAEYLTATP